MNRLLIIIMSLTACLGVQAQGRKGCLSREQFCEWQRQYIEDKAGLTEEESARFFPLYFELQDRKFSYNEKMRNKLSRTKENGNATDAEYSKIIEEVIRTRITIDELELEYLQKYKKILSPKKIYDIQKAEVKFGHELFKRARNHKR